jgi:hypothetical protein
MPWIVLRMGSVIRKALVELSSRGFVIMQGRIAISVALLLCSVTAAAAANTSTNARQHEISGTEPAKPSMVTAYPATDSDLNAWRWAGQGRQYALLLDSSSAGRLEIDDQREVHHLFKLGDAFGVSDESRGACEPAPSPGSRGIGQDCAPPTSRDLKGAALRRVVAEQTALRAEVVGKGRRFKDMEPAERETLIAKQDRLLELLAGRGDIEELSTEQREEVYAALKMIETTVARVEDDRMICERVKVVGSNRPQNKCMTVGQRRRMYQSR